MARERAAEASCHNPLVSSNTSGKLQTKEELQEILQCCNELLIKCLKVSFLGFKLRPYGYPRCTKSLIAYILTLGDALLSLLGFLLVTLQFLSAQFHYQVGVFAGLHVVFVMFIQFFFCVCIHHLSAGVSGCVSFSECYDIFLPFPIFILSGELS
jgi:hypothetical protein